MKNELKPCPFCGGDSVWLYRGMYNDNAEKEPEFYYYVSCAPHVETEWFATPEEAVKAWNTRPIENDFRRQLEEVIGQRDLAANLAISALERLPMTEDDKRTVRDLKKKWKGEA